MVRWADLIDLDDEAQTLWSWGARPPDVGESTRTVRRTASTPPDAGAAGHIGVAVALGPASSSREELAFDSEDEGFRQWSRQGTLESVAEHAVGRVDVRRWIETTESQPSLGRDRWPSPEPRWSRAETEEALGQVIEDNQFAWRRHAIEEHAAVSLESEGLDDVHVPWVRDSSLESAVSDDPFASWDDFGAMERQISGFSQQSSEPVRGTDKALDCPGGPRLATHGQMQSTGSAGHPLDCVACAFYCFRKAGCTNGVDCQYCHMTHLSKSRERRAGWKQKATENRQKRRLAASAALKPIGGQQGEQDDEQHVQQASVQQHC